MPYQINKRGNEFCVVKQSDKSIVKCHATEAQAKAHMDALYANVPDVKTIEDEEMSRQDRAKAKRRQREKQQQIVKDLNDLESTFSAFRLPSFDEINTARVLDESEETPAPQPEPMQDKYEWVAPVVTDEQKETPIILNPVVMDKPLNEADVQRIAAETVARIVQDAIKDTKTEPAQATTQTITVDVADFQKQIAEANERVAQAEAEAKELQGQLDAIGEKQGVIERIKSFFNHKKEDKSTVQPFTLYKDKATSRLRFLAVASNNYRDQDRPPQIITEAAHKEFESYLDTHPADMPELWHWHVPGSRYGKTDMAAYVNGFKMYSGLIDAGMEKVAERIAKDNPEMSHGFKVMQYDPKQELINQYRTFEISTLPATRAANRWTSFNVIMKEVEGMAGLNPAKRKDFVEKFGEDFVAKLEAGTAEAKEILSAIGVESKEQTPPAETKTEEPKPEAKAEPSLSDVMTAVTKLNESVTALTSKQKEQDTVIADLQKSEDEKVARLLQPRWYPQQAKRASEAKETVLKEGSEEDKKLKAAQPSETAEVLAKAIYGG